MFQFILKRLAYGFLVLLGVAIAVFLLFQVLPGDPVAMMAGQRTDVSTRESITRDFGLDKPIGERLVLYLKDLSPLAWYENTEENRQKYGYTELVKAGNGALVLKSPYLRRSFQTNKRVDEIILDNLEGTIWLATAAMLFATGFGIFFGTVAALRQNTFWDHTLVSLSVVGISVPSFVMAILISLVFGYYLSDYTGLNLTGSLWVNDPVKGRYLELKNLILPAFTLGLRPLAIITQLTRSAMLEVLSQDYIRTARAKGLRFYQVVLKHALKNALNPVITAVSGWLASLMAGAFFIEYIFSWKGLGSVTISSVLNLDFPVVMGTTLVVALIFILVSILVDILYAALDPRIRLG
ncbi:MAG: ABC transporter permease [Ferruginibacter sp.]|nr:ABC transporter permease [Cytophagales bacterium]